MVRLFLIIQVSDASDKGRMTLTLCPINRFSLRFESAEHVVGMVFDNIIVDMTSLGAAFRPRFNVNVRHALLPLGTLSEKIRIARRVGDPPALMVPKREDEFKLNA